MAKIVCVCMLLLFSFGKAQSYADASYYLLDSLDFKQISEEDKVVLDRLFIKYYQTKSDSIRIGLLIDFVENCWDSKLWNRYNDYTIEKYKRYVKKSDHPYFIQKIGEAYHNKGYYYTDLEFNIDSATKYYQMAAQNFELVNLPIEQATSLVSLGAALFSNHQIHEAINYYNQCLEIYENEKDYEGLAYTYNYLAVLHLKYDPSPENCKYLDLAYENAKKIDLVEGMIMSLSTRTNYLRQEKKYQEALIKDLKNLEIAKRATNPYHVFSVYTNLALDYYYLDDLENANKYGQLFLNNKNSNQYEELKINILNTLAKVEYKRNNYNAALQYINHALSIPSETEATLQAYQISHSIYAKKNDYLNAYKSLLKFVEKNDKLYNSDNKKMVLKRTLEYQFKKQKEIDELKNERQLLLFKTEQQQANRTMITAFSVAGMILLFAIILLNRLRVIRKQKKQLNLAYKQLEESKKNELAVSNLKALQSQMNPHFIFNALNSVQDLVLLKDVRNSNKYLGRFSDLIRRILISSKKQFITLAEELEILSLYLDLEKLRFGEEFNVSLICDVSESKQEEIELPSMFIQPYIENAIKHGLFNKSGKKELLVHFRLLKNNLLECIIQDNGVGQVKAAEFSEKRIHRHTGFSTSAINERINLLNQTLDRKIEITVLDLYENHQPTGTKIVLVFPV